MDTERGRRRRQPVRGLSFGSVAESYERYRLSYPKELVNIVLGYAERPVGGALEVGAGTGKATRLFGARGIEVTALEPDADMVQMLKRTTHGLPVKPVITTFEQFRTDCRFDLLYAAAAWHWTDPATRWARAAERLVPGGVLALFGRPGELKDQALFAAIDDIEKRALPEDDGGAGHPWSIEEMACADGLTDVAEHDLPSAVTATAADFLGRLSTVSAYLMLSPEHRAETLRQIRAVLPDHFEIDTTVQLALARRV